MFCAAREWVEPLAALGLYWKVMLLIGTSTVRSAPSTLAVKLLCEEALPDSDAVVVASSV